MILLLYFYIVDNIYFIHTYIFLIIKWLFEEINLDMKKLQGEWDRDW